MANDRRGDAMSGHRFVIAGICSIALKIMILNPAVRKAPFSGIFGANGLKTIFLTSIASQVVRYG